jgi:hypothetical protein
MGIGLISLVNLCARGRGAHPEREERHAYRSCAPGERTRDQSDLEIKGGAPSTGAVGATCVPFLAGNKLAWKDHYIGGARLGKADLSACAESRTLRQNASAV